MSTPPETGGWGAGWVRSVSSLAQGGRWLRAYAALHALLGVFMVLSVVGIVLAWAFFWMAWLMYQAALAADRVRATGDPAAVAEALDRIALQFVVQLGVVVATLLIWVAVGMMGGVPVALPPGVGLSPSG